MRFSPVSFVLGLAAASVLPIVSRAFRPLAVEATAVGMSVAEELRRIAAEQMENLEDIVAEARVRREELATAADLGDEGEAAHPEKGAEETPEAPAVGRARRRGTGRVRPHVT
jgi:hypothetical protein